MPHRRNQTSYKKGHAPTYGPQVKRRIVAGQQFAAWTIIHEVEPARHQRRFMCRCECGKEKIVWLDSMTKGKSRSCGCKKIPSRTTHGLTDHPLYQMWSSIKNRCLNPRTPAYRRYGGRGICISFIWQNDASAFVEWALRNGWSPELEIDRIDNDGDYDPANCRFITRAENMVKGDRRPLNRDQIYFPHEVAAALSLAG